VKALTQILESAMNPVRKVLFVAVVAMFGLQVIAVFSQVVLRFIFKAPPDWTEELAKFLQVWIILLTSAICIKEGSHLVVDYLVHYLPFQCKKILKLIVTFLIMIFLSVLVVAGINMMKVGSSQTSPALNLPMSLIYLVFPIAGTLMWLESLIVLLKTFSSSNKQELEAVENVAKLESSTA